MVVAADRVETSLRDQGSGTNSTGKAVNLAGSMYRALKYRIACSRLAA